MGSCPVCGTKVTEDFGLVECAKCKAQLIVGIDGSVQVAGEESAPMESAELPVDEPGEVFPPSQDDFLADEIPIEDEAVEGPPPPPLESASPENTFQDDLAVQASDAPQAYRSPGTAPDSPNLSDLAAFANSEDSGGREGPLRYTLMITGIDTVDVRDAFREALTDRKFMWDIDQILRNIRHGNVQIDNVSPGKAYILVNRLRNLPLQIRWEQHAITQA